MQLLERKHFLDVLAGYADEAAAGNGRFVMVTGEAGIGKTSLLEAFRDRHTEVRWLWGACDGTFTPQPLGPVHEIALSVGGRLVELFGPDVDRRLLFSSFLADLQSSPLPTVVVVEDLHWADEATLDWLVFLARRVKGTRTLIVVSYRDDELYDDDALRRVVSQIATYRSTSRLSLPPLSPDGVRTLAGARADDVFRVTGGNPFYVVEVLDAAEQQVPATVSDVVRARTGKLGDDARQLLYAAAALGHPSPAGLIAEVAGTVPDALDECLAAGALGTEEGRFRFRHELTRQAVEESVPPYRRSQLHANALRALQGSADHARLAYHADAAGDSAAAVAHAVEAAERAASLGSNREAVVQFRRALRHADDQPPEMRARIHDGLAYALGYQELWEESLPHREESVELRRRLGDRDALSRALRALTHTYWRLCRPEEDAKTADEYMALMRDATDSPEKGMAHLSYLRFVAPDSEEHESLLSEAERISRVFDAPALRSDVLAQRAWTLIGRNDDRGFAMQAEAIELAKRAGDDITAARHYTNLYEGAVALFRLEEFDWSYDEGMSFITERDIATYDKCLMGSRITYLMRKGRYDEVRDVGAVSLQPPLSPVNELHQKIPYAAAALRAGAEDGLALLEHVRRLAQGATEVEYRIRVAMVTAQAAWLTGRSDLVDDDVLELGERANDAEMWEHAELASWLHRTGHPVAVRRELPEPFSWEVAGDHVQAAAFWREHGCPFEEGAALYFAGDVDSLRRAHELFTSIGATPAAAITRKALRDAGEQVVPRGPRTSTRANEHGLTARESEILTLLQQGLTNAAIAERLVISRRTVDHHVSAVLAKVGVDRRSELIAT